ncbi:uncharacterized protein gpr179 [Synchiropus picturatus]
MTRLLLAMGPVWTLLLMTSGVTAGTDNTTELLANATGSPGDATSSRPEEATPTVEDDWTPAEMFLFTGDSAVLAGARCSRAYSPPGQQGPLPRSFVAPLRPALDALTNAANFLNMIFQASDLRESTVQEDMEWYHAQVRALLEADRSVRRAVLTFDADPTAAAPQLVLSASRGTFAKTPAIELRDLSRSWDGLHPPPPAPDDAWFRAFKFPGSSRQPGLSKRLLLNDLSTLDTPKWGRGDGYVSDRTGVRWDSAPYLDCVEGRFLPNWTLILSTSFYGLKPDLTPEFRGVIRVDVDVQSVDLDQCSSGPGWFSDSHQCNRTTMECVPTPGRGFRLGQYCCRCREGFYEPDGAVVNATCYPAMPICLPCWPGCASCRDGSPCWVQEDWLLRTGVLAVQGVFMLLIFVSMLAAYRHRRNRRIRASGLLLLEMILFGSLLLYFPVFILYFKPSTFRCILLRWVRMVGFSIVYGTVTLKMYRVLKVFLSRTAQRVPYMSSLHLLRILGVMLMTVSWFLCAWTVGVLQNRDRNIPVFFTATTAGGQGFNLCYLDRWDYMMAVAELLFLCWGSSLWTAVRPVPSAFHEPRYMGIAIHNELLLSSMFHLLRFTFPSLHPDWMLLLSFTHTHVTVTVTLALILLPKFLLGSKSGREEIAAEVYEEEVDLRRSYLNNSFHSAWSERSVDPDDFRDELKKLYSQLEVNKTKKMAANNPHLSKKRSSRCALGRSLIKKIAEIPETVSRQCSREDRDGSFRSRCGTPSGSFRTQDNISYRSSIKSPLPSMRKSHGDSYAREREPSLNDPFLRANVEKRASQRSETDSLDIPAGFCKSASAQNLSIDTNLLHPDHTRLHKSWSLTSTTSPSIENVAKVNRSSTMMAQSRQSISISDQTKSALQSESFDKAEICPWEVEKEPSEDKSQKHVTYANSQESDSEHKPSSPVALVCPWDHLENTRDTGDMQPHKTPVHVSASAPGSPRPKAVKDQRVFSFRNTTTKWLHVRSFMGSMEAAARSSKDGRLNREDSASQKSQSSTRSGSSSRRPSIEKRGLQKRSMTTIDGKPCLVKQNAIRLSSGDSSDRSPRRLVMIKSAVCPWDGDEAQRDGTYDNVFLSRQNSKRSSVTSWETGSSSRTPSTHRRGSHRVTPLRNVSHVDICPWEAPAAAHQGEEAKRQLSIKADVCPWESEQSSTSQWDSQGTLRKQIPVISTRSVSKASLPPSTDVCPWEAPDAAVPMIRQDHEYANVCPWEVQSPTEAVYENLNPVTRGSLKVPVRQEVMKNAVYPSVPGQEGLSQDKTAPPGHPGIKTAESCPWEFPDPPTDFKDVCPWEEGEISAVSSQITVKAQICPWETQHQEQPEIPPKGVSKTLSLPSRPVANMSSREAEKPSKAVASKTMSQGPERRADVCPWETEELEAEPVVPNTAESARQDAARASVCPWETASPQTSQRTASQEEPDGDTNKHDSARENVCPWETTGPSQLQKTESGPVEVPGAVKTQESKLSESLSKLHNNSMDDVCPWESGDTQKQDSVRTNVCPWETEEQETARAPVSKLQRQQQSTEEGQRAGTKSPKVQDSVLADVCPWETEEAKVLKKQESGRTDVCPWETEEPKVLKKQESVRADVCPWETEDAKVLERQDSGRADVCPWESERPKVLMKQESVRADVCPWETDEPQLLQRQDSARAHACPWEMEERGVSPVSEPSKPEVTVDFTNSDGPTEIQGPTSGEGTAPDSAADGSKANLGRRDALCPWELTRSRSSSFTDNNSDVFTWEPENIPEEDEEDDAECAAEALIFPPDL